METENAGIANTLGVALYRVGDWQRALDTLEPLLEDPEQRHSYNYFFIAMSHWQLGEKAAALKACAEGEQWMNANAPKDAELIRFREEAMRLLHAAGQADAVLE